MVILTQTHKCIFDIQGTNKILVRDSRIIAMANNNNLEVTLGFYSSDDKAKTILEDLFNAIALNHRTYVMPSNEVVPTKADIDTENIEYDEQ